MGLQVVDERMWGDDDKPEPDQKPGEEQRGKDAPAQVTGSEKPAKQTLVELYCLTANPYATSPEKRTWAIARLCCICGQKSIHCSSNLEPSTCNTARAEPGQAPVVPYAVPKAFY